jgi:hypothetical protein
MRLLRSASRNSATVFASTPALRAPREAVRAVVFAVLRAFCWRPRACPPFLAAALRLVEDPLADDAFVREELVERLLLAVDPLFLLAVERLLLAVERLLLADDDRGLLADERPLAADERLLLADDRLDPLAFFDPPRELPLLRRSAIWFPSSVPLPVV